MGLTSWAHSPNGKIYKTDVTVAKNYLKEKELHRLRLAVSAFLDLAEMRAELRLPTTMQDWITFMSGYLDLNGYPVLEGLGKMSKEQADEKALNEYSRFRVIQDRSYENDFEKIIKDVKQKPSKSIKNGKA